MENLTLLLPNLSRSRALHFVLVASRDRYVHKKYENGHETLNEVLRYLLLLCFQKRRLFYLF
jgi:hypothetical protein